MEQLHLIFVRDASDLPPSINFDRVQAREEEEKKWFAS